MIFNPFKFKSKAGGGIFKPKSKLGIDIGTASIKIVELKKESGRFILTNYGLFELKSLNTAATRNFSPEVKNKGISRLPDQEVVWGIKEVIKKAKIASIDVIASIPSFSTFATVIELPYLSGDDLEKAVFFEAKKYVPIPIDDVVLDWSIIEVINQNKIETVIKEGVTTQNPSAVEIFLAAVPREETEKYKTIMKNAGLNLRALELENSALIRALVGNDLSPIAIVNIGGRSTSITVVSKGYERVSHSYEVGGFEITKSIARSLNISPDKADELKMKFGLKAGEENIINDSMVSLIDMMAFETRKTIASYEESKNQTVSKILLIGGVANIPNFLEYFKTKLGRPIYSGNPFSRVIYPPELAPAISNISNIMGVAIGLAMREL